MAQERYLPLVLVEASDLFEELTRSAAQSLTVVFLASLLFIIFIGALWVKATQPKS